MFALTICIAAGIRPIITSSSDVKLDKLKQLDSGIGLVNYKTHPGIATEVLRLTDSKGIVYVRNNIGVASIPEDLQILRIRGSRVALISFLNGFEANWPRSLLMMLMAEKAQVVEPDLKICCIALTIILTGLLGGSKTDFEALSAFFVEKEMRLDTFTDRIFSFRILGIGQACW